MAPGVAVGDNSRKGAVGAISPGRRDAGSGADRSE